MSLPPRLTAENSSIRTGDSPSTELGLQGVNLPIGRGRLRPTRGGSSLHGENGCGLHQNQTRTPAQPSGLRFSSTMDPNFAVVIESSVPRNDSPDSSSPAHRRSSRPPKKLSATSQLVTASSRTGRPPRALSGGANGLGSSVGRKVGRRRTHPLFESKSKGRPRKTIDPKLVSPKFIPFLCEWRDCKAELHNLETLRKHIYTVHNKVQLSGGVLCQWAKCGLTCQARDEATLELKLIHEDQDFVSIEKFKDHVESIHLIPFAWHMGDGPRSSTLDSYESDASICLNDVAGGQITPPILSQLVKGGNANTRSLTEEKRLIDPALECLDVLASPSIRNGFGRRQI